MKFKNGLKIILVINLILSICTPVLAQSERVCVRSRTRSVCGSRNIRIRRNNSSNSNNNRRDNYRNLRTNKRLCYKFSVDQNRCLVYFDINDEGEYVVPRR